MGGCLGAKKGGRGAEVGDQRALPHDYFRDPKSLLDALKEGDVALIKRDWLLSGCPRIWPRRQELPREAVWEPEELERLGIDHQIVALSYCWLSPDHPDPEGEQFAVLRPFIEESRFQAFFIDWLSLFQNERSSEEALAFKRSLKHINLWYAHQCTVKWLLTQPFVAASLPYRERGWPTFESAISTLISSSDDVLDLGKAKLTWEREQTWWRSNGGSPGVERGQSYQQAKTTGCFQRPPPLAPEDFAAALGGKRFTNGADRELVVRKYRETALAILSQVKELDFHGLGWKDRDADVLARALPFCAQLETLRVDDNLLCDRGVKALARVAGKVCPQLRSIWLFGNDISGKASVAAAVRSSLPSSCECHFSPDALMPCECWSGRPIRAGASACATCSSWGEWRGEMERCDFDNGFEAGVTDSGRAVFCAGCRRKKRFEETSDYAEASCVHGRGLVRLPRGRSAPAEGLRPGDEVQTPEGPAAVLCVVVSPCAAGGALLAELEGGLLISGGHPVLWKGRWRRPQELATVSWRRCPRLYNFVLSRGGALTVDGVLCAALGASLGGEMAWHPYWGSRRVLDDLRRHPSWDSGVVEWTAECRRVAGEAAQVEAAGRACSAGLPKLDAQLLRHLHEAACGPIGGALRAGPASIAGSAHRPPDAEEVPGLLQSCCEETSRALASAADSVTVAAYCLWWVNHMHPFPDGNGRAARGLAWLVAAFADGSRRPGCTEPHAPFHTPGVRGRYLAGLQKADARHLGSGLPCTRFLPEAVAELADLLREVWW